MFLAAQRRHTLLDLGMHTERFYKIRKHLYMSGQEAATDHQLNRTMQFKLVVNCTNNLPFIHPKAGNTTYHKVALEDNLKQKEIIKMAVALPVIVEMIHDTICADGAVLVHCRMGQQRSATFIAAYIMWVDHVSHVEAIKSVQAVNPAAFQPAPNFIKSLELFTSRCHQDTRANARHTNRSQIV